MLENEVSEEQLKKNLLERNSPEELATRLVEHMKLLNAAEPILKWADVNRVETTRKLPFIPEDLGFQEHTQNIPGMPTIRIYHRADFFKNGISISKTRGGLWSVVFEKDRVGEDDEGNDIVIDVAKFKMEFKIDNKFRAIIIFTALGLDFIGNESTVPDIINKPITEILEEGKEEE